MKIQLNIGLIKTDGTPLKPQTAIAYLNQLGVISTLRIVDSTEPTITAEVDSILSGPPLRNWIHATALELEQDCIACVIPDGKRELVGQLIGPNSAKWEPFNYSYFVEPSPTLAIPETDSKTTCNEFTREEFIHYLRDCIIPDSKESGSEGYAEDLETALFFILNR